MKKNSDIPVGKKIFYYLCLFIIGLIFFILLGEDGPVIMNDSTTYLSNSRNMGIGYSFYPIFLRILYLTIGENYYLWAAFLIQSIYAMLASILISEFIRRRFELNYFQTIIIFLFTFLPLSLHMLSHFAFAGKCCNTSYINRSYIYFDFSYFISAIYYICIE